MAATSPTPFEASHAIRRSAAAFLQDYDLLLTPTTPCVAWPANDLGPARIAGLTVAPRAHAVFTPFFNHALAPALSLPCGVGRDNLPVGLQLIARRGCDRSSNSRARPSKSCPASATTRGNDACCASAWP
jgi:aspartyl-tRNA(Asn)/glutamyl-tRNA(Gln) amidotransferase subunit A